MVVAFAQEAIKLGQATRATASTNMNEHSSRSHCMLQVYITAESADTTLSSKLNLIDLVSRKRNQNAMLLLFFSADNELNESTLWEQAGCERVSRSGATGQQLKEATSINGSLSALGTPLHRRNPPKPLAERSRGLGCTQAT